MNFKEYLVYEEDYKVFSSLSEGEMADALLSLPKFVSGATGNLIGQGLRGVGNIGQGGLRAAYGLGQSGLGALQYMGGNKEARKKASEKIKSGFKNLAGGVGGAVRGATQIVAAPLSAPIRGAQAVDDKTMSGILAPNDPKRSYIQDLLGLDSGVTPEKSPKAIQKTSQEKQPAQIPQEWYELTDKLRKASSTKEGAAIVSKMARKYPELYAAARKRALSLSRGRPSTNPSGQLRSTSRRARPN
jgi:hypothetical protein